MSGRTPAEVTHKASLSAAMKAVRNLRRLRASEVAREMGMPLRTYEHFESGRGRFSHDRLARFAAITESDPVALYAAMVLNAPEIAVRSADNKLLFVMMMALGELNEELGPDLVFLETGIIIGAITRVCKELAQHVRKRDTFAETWLKERSTRSAGADIAAIAARLGPKRPQT